MKVLAAFNDLTLLKELSSRNLFTSISSVASYQEIIDYSGHVDMVICSDQWSNPLPPWEWMSGIRKKYPRPTRIVTLMSHLRDRIVVEMMVRIAESEQIEWIHPGLTTHELAHSIASLVSEAPEFDLQLKGKLIAAIGASPRVGVTTTLVNMAFMLAKNTSLSIGLLDLNLKSPDLGEHLGIRRSLKDLLLIHSDLTSRLLTSEGLMKNMEQIKGIPRLSVLRGSNRREYAELITKEEMAELLRVARSSFDLILVDVSSYPDNAATIKALLAADERWLVTEPVRTSFQTGWNDWYDNVYSLFGLGTKDFKLIVNKEYTQGLPAETIASHMGVELIGRLPYLHQEAIEAIQLGKPLTLTEKEGSLWHQSMEALFVPLADRFGWEYHLHQSSGWMHRTKSRIRAYYHRSAAL